MNKTKIEWCDATVNPVVGCTYNCPYCYARNLNKRFSFVEDFSKPKFFSERLRQLEAKNGKIIFMDSMSDVADWKPEWFKDTYYAMCKNPQHHYLFLTKRPEKISNFASQTEGTSNIWWGTTVTCEKDVNKYQYLPKSGNRFVSIEPVLENLHISEKHALLSKFVDWIIIGAETGKRKDKIIPKKEWVNDIVKNAKANGVPVFMKESLHAVMGKENMLREFPELLMWLMCIGDSEDGEVAA